MYSLLGGDPGTFKKSWADTWFAGRWENPGRENSPCKNLDLRGKPMSESDIAMNYEYSLGTALEGTQ